MNKKVIFIAGPTAVGKTEVAVYLAKKANAEIISCDSMQIYKGMDIITSKPSGVLRKKVNHHLIGVVPPTSEYNVSKYRQDAVEKIQEVFTRGRFPIFVGGSGLYMSILIDGIFNLEQKSRSMRKRLYKLAGLYGNQYLYKRLHNIDPQAALRIHPNDTKRLIRALEVFKSTGKPISFLQKQRIGLNQEYDVKVFCLNMPREKLYKIIDERVDKMFANGLVGEVKRLLKLKLSKTASCAIGIKEIKGYLSGLYDLSEAMRLMKQNTRNYAKRQLTWFRKDKRIRWINIDDAEKPQEIVKRLWKELF